MSKSDDIERQTVATSKKPQGEPQQCQLVTCEHNEENLLPVVDDVPFAVWLIAFVGAAERFVWYGATSPLQNYIQHSSSSKVPGVLGLREATATNIVNAMMAGGYLATIPAAAVADTWLGRYRTILVSAVIQLCGSAILFATSFPHAVQAGAAEGGLAAAIILIAVGSGGVRSSVAPFIAEQYTETTPKVKVLKNGRKVITDRELTIQYIYNLYYWMVNIGGLSALTTTILEKYVGYWAAYLVPLCMMALSVVPLLAWQHIFVRRPPSGSVLPQAGRAMLYGFREGFQMDGAKPQKQQEKHHRQVPWTDTFIDELKSGLLACRPPLPHTLVTQTFNNLISQAGQMVNSGVPNDTIKSLNPITSILLTPIVSRGLYPLLTQHRIRFGPMARIVVGFLFLTLAMAYTAILQKLVYSTGPCYDHPLACPESDHGRIPNQISMFLQTPIYVLGAIAEIFCFTTGTEYAYNQAPKSMKSVVQSVWMATAGVGACLAMAFTPINKDPHLVVMYSSLAGVMAVATVLFGIFFGKHDRKKTILL
ncbi:oligopeptide transporter [Aspergillus fischeri NRRL 181]|uniref:Oligopeptide transporter n=1 Tax=Neosartorya fischeri (strain ATCC 1020 / DSM 3700 / CBS 544.65 / FGSC A1164 / JCM 1740 / NRRL 181 / WB 181) TaxID=331117 RepID=A1DK22_NEOFI|nr:oligopeptide transporter [Aspergillus fischeri NRRL 181]EAW17061.1 oligopeptide transporter [Aspergillus fischeri NRRL 181]